VSTRIGDLVRLDRPEHSPPAPPTVIALRGIIAVHRDRDALDNDPTEVILEGGVKITIGRGEGEFVRREWENWAAHGRPR